MATGHTETVDKYLEAIYYIAGEGEVVRPSRLAYWLSVSAPTVRNPRRLGLEGRWRMRQISRKDFRSPSR